MNSTNTKLKPLEHKNSSNITPLGQGALKQSARKPSVPAPQKKKNEPEQNPAFQKIKYTRSSNRINTSKVQLYECDDLDMPMLEDEANYFEQQLQRSSKVETNTNNKTQKPVPKNQVVLPKLQGDQSIRKLKDIEMEMDAQMSKMFEKEMNQDY